MWHRRVARKVWHRKGGVEVRGHGTGMRPGRQACIGGRIREVWHRREAWHGRELPVFVCVFIAQLHQVRIPPDLLMSSFHLPAAALQLHKLRGENITT